MGTDCGQVPWEFPFEPGLLQEQSGGVKEPEGLVAWEERRHLFLASTTLDGVRKNHNLLDALT